MFQTSILLLFNHRESYTLQEIQTNTALEIDRLDQIIKQLVSFNVLRTSGEETIELNTDFSSRKIRINLALPLKAEAKQETEQTHQSVREDRNLVIQVWDLEYMWVEIRL